jgi:transposase-like protein
MSITTELIETGAKRDGRGRRIATREEKVALIAQYRGSGLTQRAFAEREGIKFSTFTAWVQGRRLARRGGSRKARFAEVPMLSVPAMLVGLAVHLPDGVIVRGTSASEVAALVRALRDGPRC